jgi:hypothetical protein
MLTFAVSVTRADNFEVTVSADLPEDAISMIRWAVLDVVERPDPLNVLVGRLVQAVLRLADYHNTADSFTVSNSPLGNGRTITISISDERVCDEQAGSTDYYDFANLAEWFDSIQV